MKAGLVTIHSILDNLALPNLNEYKEAIGYFKKKNFKENSSSVLQDLNVKYRNIDDNVNTLSGGNQQKIVLSKWLLKKPDFFIFDEPTVGVDVGTRRQVYEIIHEIASNGNSVMVISSDLDEIIEINPNRVMVMREGEVSGILNEFDHKRILNLCYGSEN
jgi:ABC-type sugar transport system ATPase subunit